MSHLRVSMVLGPLVFLFLLGCGESKTVIPTKPLTEEQKKAVMEEDKRVEDEESQGKMPKKKAAKGK